MKKDLRQRLDNAIQQSIAQAQVPGAAIALRINGQPILATGIGYRDLQQTIALPAEAHCAVSRRHPLLSRVEQMTQPLKVFGPHLH
ncbi:serine hydrolase [Nodosilinea sp. LEGE 07088]|uniref:serine hydrolase n=1 Tax=Nodosilinea sp. LEGE 07088 TaxID=2777968 RepID=UPI0018821914|nr:serine hydrolase [Nodosilinea sp. LEGE 07088]MBE9136540.1 serine hydrolase [Nodosilinea sp. LEGE 07088]